MTTCTAQSLRGRALGVSSVRGNRIPFREIATAVSRREQAGRRGYVDGISFPRDCDVALCAPRNDNAVRARVRFYIVFRSVCRDGRDIIRRRYFRLTKRDKKRIMY